MARKLLTVTGVIIAVMWVVKNPAGAAADVRQLIAAVSAFVNHL